MPADRQAALDAAQETYKRQVAELADQHHQAFTAAVEKTKAILTPDQRKKYEQILAHRAEHRRGSTTRDAGTTAERPANATPNP